MSAYYLHRAFACPLAFQSTLLNAHGAVASSVLPEAARRMQETEAGYKRSDTVCAINVRWRLRLACILLMSSAASPAIAATQHVVLLYDERTELPGLAQLDHSLSDTLTRSGRTIEIYREAMDLSRFGSDAYLRELRDHLRAKYRAKKIDVAVAVMGPALDFLLSHGPEVFPGTPIVFCGVDRTELGDAPLPPNVTGVLLERKFYPTLELALAIHPRTRRVVFVGGTSKFDTRLVEQARNELRSYQNRVQLTFLTDLPLPALLEELSRLPPRTVVLYSTLFRDGAGKAFVPHQVVEQVAAAASVPVYGFVDQYLGHGIVGGDLYTLETHGQHAARLTMKLLDGARPADLPRIEAAASQILFDGRQLARWGINDARLPDGSRVLFRTPTLWSQYRAAIIGVGLVVALQAALIGGLLLQRQRRRRMETRLKESEMRFRTVADTVPAMIWISDAEGRLVFVNRYWQTFTGESLSPMGRIAGLPLHPEDRRRCIELYKQRAALRQEFTMECRLRRHDGTYIWMACAGAPRIAVDGAFSGYIGSCIDIDPLREAEHEKQLHQAELAHVARVATMGELTASVAHELNQPLTAILANSDVAERILLSASPAIEEVREILADIRADDRRAAEIIGRMRSLLQKHEVVYRPIEINETVDEVVRLLRSEAITRRVTLSLERGEEEVFVSGDRIHLQQVVVNLVMNAFEAMAAVPGTERRITVRTNLDARAATITVSDSGPGVAEDRIPQLFAPFYPTKQDGLGMGLSITRSIVEAHGGRLWVENNPGGGATFGAMLPLLDPDRHEGPALDASNNGTDRNESEENRPSRAGSTDSTASED